MIFLPSSVDRDRTAFERFACSLHDLAAFAEVVWSPPVDREPGSTASKEFLDRLERRHLPQLDAYGVEYRPLAGPHPWQTRPGVQGYPRDLAAETAVGGWAGIGGWREDGGAENLPDPTGGT